jgi:NADPH:quinone reductase-like Zn-dependent oxidoreductase
VLIRLEIAGVGPWDLEIRDGEIPPRKLHFPLVLGVDGAGVAAAVGARVRASRSATESIPIAGTIRRAASMPNMWPCRPRRSPACQNRSISNMPTPFRQPG